VEDLILALDELPVEFLTRFRSFSSSTDGKVISKVFRRKMTIWTGHLYALSVDQCGDIQCSLHCPNFMLGCDCVHSHAVFECDLCTLGFDLLDLFSLLVSALPSSDDTFDVSTSVRSSPPTFKLPLSPERFMKRVKQMKEDFCFYVAHRWRSKVQRKVLPDYRANIGKFEAAVIMDYKMKILEVWKDETQSLFFGKKGNSLLGTVMYYRLDGEKVLKRRYFCIAGQDCAQDAETTSFILAALMEPLTRLGIKTVHLLSDGARNFQCVDLLSRIHTLNNYCASLGLDSIQIVDCSFTEAGEGKSELDGTFATISRFVREYAMAGNNVTTSGELRKCLTEKLAGDEKNSILLLKEVKFYKKLFKKHASYDDNLKLFYGDADRFVFDSSESFTRYKRWYFGKNFAVLQTATHADLTSASFWQSTSEGWKHVPKPKPPISRPPAPIKNTRLSISKYNAACQAPPSLLATPSSQPTSSQSIPNPALSTSKEMPSPSQSGLSWIENSSASSSSLVSNCVPYSSTTNSFMLPDSTPPWSSFHIPTTQTPSNSLPFSFTTNPPVLPAFALPNPFYFGMAKLYPKVTRERLPENQKEYLKNYLQKGGKSELAELRQQLCKKFPKDSTIMTVKQIKSFLRIAKEKKVTQQPSLEQKKCIKKTKKVLQ